MKTQRECYQASSPFLVKLAQEVFHVLVCELNSTNKAWIPGTLIRQIGEWRDGAVNHGKATAEMKGLL